MFNECSDSWISGTCKVPLDTCHLGQVSSWHHLMDTHNKQWQWWLSLHSPTREPRLRDVRDWLQFLGPSVHSDTACPYLVWSLLYQVGTLRPKESPKVTLSTCSYADSFLKKILWNHFNIEDGRKKHFWHIMLYFFKKGKNTTEMQKKKKKTDKRFVQCMEK